MIKQLNLKFIENISNDKETNYEILRNIFNIRIIRLENVYFKLIKEKNQYFIQVFEDNIEEQKIEIQKPKDLEVKPNKKIAIMCQ